MDFNMAEGINKSNNTLIKRERGKGFPKLSLASSVEVIEKASKYGRQWTREQFATFGSKAGSGSAKSGAFLNRLAALRDFGLIDINGVIITRTELADQIVKPVKPEEKENAVRQAFLNVDIFKAIVETVSHGVDLSKSDIAEMAVKQLGVIRNVKDTFVSSFIESGKLAGIVSEVADNGIQINLPGPIPESQPVNKNEVENTLLEEHQDFLNQSFAGSASTSFSTKRVGKTWDVSVGVRSSQEIDNELVGKIIKLIQDAEMIAKSFKKSEEENANPDNKS